MMTGTPGVLPVLAIDTETGVKPLWYVMPLANLLRETLAEAETFQEIVSAFADLAETLAELAKEGIYHCGIKPDNLFWHDGNAVLGDFGIARWGEAGLTAVRRKLGPMAFIAWAVTALRADCGTAITTARASGPAAIEAQMLVRSAVVRSRDRRRSAPEAIRDLSAGGSSLRERTGIAVLLVVSGLCCRRRKPRTP
ncbi:hypothetical protein [Kitasatospora sp. NPDC057223]|uniref:hypothetical protein n=1 Tax=Kitasatospora sp. NPDC057223 TaxID=3346055 RepID=UPI003644D9C9